jgi:DNA (cytosine-5)-methyltransferase 1
MLTDRDRATKFDRKSYSKRKSRMTFTTALRQSDQDETELSGNKEPRRLSLSMVDLFAGCGGLSLGFENAGFTPVFVNELNQDALDSYLANRHHSIGGMKFADNADLRCNDAHTLHGKRLKKLIGDLGDIPELRLSFDRGANITSGAGSNLDVLTGGPPCQGFSGIGHRRSYAVDKSDLPSNHLYARMAQIIGELRPRIFLFENVRGLLNSKWTRGEDDRIWPEVLAEYRRIKGYEVRWSLVRARDYGVPQNRPRVLMVGIRKDVIAACDTLEPQADAEDAIKCGFLPSPETGAFPDLVDLLGDLIDPSVSVALHNGDFPSGSFATRKYPKEATTNIQKKLRAIPAGRVRTGLTDQEYSRHAPRVVEKFLHMLAHNGEIPEHMQTKKFSQRVLKARWGNGGPTITATSMPDDYVHFSQPRILTVREWARLQLFPDWYQFMGKRTTGGIRRAGNPQQGLFDREVPKYTQIGNAVPVELAERVGRHFSDIIAQAFGKHA